MKAQTYSKTGSKASTQMSLDKNIFEVEPKNNELLAQAYEHARINSRTVNSRAKTRAEVRGGGRKPWKQKGTGRARAGSIRSPIWRGGGITFGPSGLPKSSSLSKKSKTTALKQALSLAAKQDAVVVIGDLPVGGKTKDMDQLLSKIGLNRAVTVVLGEDDVKIKRAISNLPYAKVTTANRLSASEVLDSTTLLFDDAGLKQLANRLGGKDGK